MREMTKVIAENEEHNTGYLMSTSKCYVCCVFKRGTLRRISYAVFGLDKKIYNVLENVSSVIEVLVRMLTNEAILGAKVFEIVY